jgi:hypothetical protein
MADPKLPAAKRRLALLLRDEEYGPKLVRLNRADERRVLELVYEGDGRQARRLINDLDSGRRRRRTLGEKARDYARKPRRQRSAEWRAIMEEVENHEGQFWALYRSAVLAA